MTSDGEALETEEFKTSRDRHTASQMPWYAKETEERLARWAQFEVQIAEPRESVEDWMRRISRLRGEK